MHPRYKTRYFKKECWPEEWVNEATSLAREIWLTYYRDSTSLLSSTATSQATTRTSTAVKVRRHFSPYHHFLCPSFHIANISFQKSLITEFDDDDTEYSLDPFEEYIRAPCIKGCDTMEHWNKQLLQGDRRLATMALNYLSTPGE